MKQRSAPPAKGQTRRRLVTASLAAALTGAAPGVLRAQAAPAAGAAAAKAPPELAADLPGAQLRGSAVMRFFGLHVYDIRLWTAGNGGDPGQPPLALELVYGRKLVGAQIASRSVDEMRRVGPVSEAQASQWLAAMTQLFPDVQAGDRLTGVMLAQGAARFHFNGRLRGDVADGDFSRLFFGIWLSPRTSEPRMREQLLGLVK